MSPPHPGVLWTHRQRFSNRDTHKRPDSVLAGKIKQLLIAKKKKIRIKSTAPALQGVSRQGEKREWKPTTKNEKQKNLPTAKLPMQQQEAKSECLENTELQTIDSLYLHLRTPTSHRITWAPRFSQCRTGADQHHFQPVFKSPTLDKDTPSSVKYLLCSVNELCYLMIAKQF